MFCLHKDYKYNLAAFGVAYHLAIFLEAPIIMIMSASIALAKDKDSFLKLRKFTYTLNLMITFLLGIILVPPIFKFLFINLIGLDKTIAEITHIASVILLPWPAVIGYRRFFQGILIRNNQTRKVLYGTIIRLLTMSVTALVLYIFFSYKGCLYWSICIDNGSSCRGPCQ